jgi:hypothetical protein
MKKILFAILFFYSGTAYIFGQETSINPEFKLYPYICNGDSTNIVLPSDFLGPKYYYGEEGSIVQFYAIDMSNVGILCAANTFLELSKFYTQSDTIMNEKGKYSITFYNAKMNLYARKLRTKKRFYMYSEASLDRRKQLDKVFGILEEKDNK